MVILHPLVHTDFFGCSRLCFGPFSPNQILVRENLNPEMRKTTKEEFKIRSLGFFIIGFKQWFDVMVAQ